MKTVILSSDNTNIIQGDFFIISSDSSREEEKNTHKKSTPDPNNGISESFDFSFVCLIKKEEKKTNYRNTQHRKTIADNKRKYYRKAQCSCSIVILYTAHTHSLDPYPVNFEKKKSDVKSPQMTTERKKPEPRSN